MLLPGGSKTGDGLHGLIRCIAQDKADEETFTAFARCIWQRLTPRLRQRYHYLRDEDIEDIIQYTIMQVLRFAKSYRGRHGNESAWAWVSRIAHRRAEGPYRARYENTLLWDDEKLDARPGRAEDDPDSPRRVDRQMWDAFRPTLDAREQAILEAHFRGASLKEIARTHGISAPRVHQILQNIIRKARKALS